jgi:solute carrier family 35 protein F5
MSERDRLTDLNDTSGLQRMDAGNTRRQRHIIGTLLILLIVIIWVSSSFLIQDLFSSDFVRPFFLTYFNTTSFTLFLIPLGLKRLAEVLHGIAGGNVEDSVVSVKQTALLSLMFCPVWFLANYMQNASLVSTSVSSSTILSSTSGLFTLILGTLLRVERFNLVKLLAVLFTLIGVVIVSADDKGTTKASIIGDICAILGAVFYGAYSVMLKLKVPDENVVPPTLFLGFVGLWNLLLLWPSFFLLSWLRIEALDPIPDSAWAKLAVNALIGTVVSDYLWVLAVLFTTPTIVTVGLSLTIPLAVLGDVFFKHINPTPLHIIGGCLVVSGFLGVNISDERVRLWERRLVSQEWRQSPWLAWLFSLEERTISAEDVDVWDSHISTNLLHDSLPSPL